MIIHTLVGEPQARMSTLQIFSRPFFSFLLQEECLVVLIYISRPLMMA